MNNGIRYESIQEPLDDEERELMDPESWDWDSAVEGIPNPNAGAILRVRFSRDEFLALERVARDQGIGPIELIHRTMLRSIAFDPHAPKATDAPRAATG